MDRYRPFGNGPIVLPGYSGILRSEEAGVCDMYNDLALASRSIVYNLGEGFDDVFFELYGISEVNQDLVEYYRATDELF